MTLPLTMDPAWCVMSRGKERLSACRQPMEGVNAHVSENWGVLPCKPRSLESLRGTAASNQFEEPLPLQGTTAKNRCQDPVPGTTVTIEKKFQELKYLNLGGASPPGEPETIKYLLHLKYLNV